MINNNVSPIQNQQLLVHSIKGLLTFRTIMVLYYVIRDALKRQIHCSYYLIRVLDDFILFSDSIFWLRVFFITTGTCSML